MLNNKKISLWLFFGLIFIIPIISWVIQKPIHLRFVSSTVALTSFGQIFALEGLVGFSLTIILSARLKILDKLFSGLNRVYINHHKMGAVSFCLLLFHPLFLAIKYLLVSSQLAAQFLLPDRLNLAKTYGIIGLLIMILLLVMTFYLSLRYHKWKLSHQFLGVAYLFGFLHLLLIPSDTSTNHFLKFYLVILGILAIAAYIYRVMLGKLLVPRYQYRLKGIKNLEGDILEIELSPLGEKLKFRPGQFGFISFFQAGFSSERHPFSFVSSPAENNLKFGVKILGDHTSEFKNLRPKTEADIEGPFGQFAEAVRPDLEQVWIAGGIGITPFVSMAKSLSPNMSARLIWSLNDPKEAAFDQELIQIQKTNRSFNYDLYIVKNNRYLSADILEKHLGELKNKEIFICGPPKMMAALRSQLAIKGIADELVHTEEFDL